jgi:hypothetical protein
MKDVNLKENEILVRLDIGKHNSESNYYFFDKYLFGYDYTRVYIPVNGNETDIKPTPTKEGWKKVFDELEIYATDKGYPVVQEVIANRRFNKETYFFYMKEEKYSVGFEITYDHIINQSDLANLIFDPLVLNDPSLVSLSCIPRIESVGGNATSIKITEFRESNPNFIPLKFEPRWFQVLPPENHPDRQSDCPFPDEVLLKAPYYKAEKLPSGSILLQMTEKTDFTKFDQVYWDKIVELYRYFAFYQSF